MQGLDSSTARAADSKSDGCGFDAHSSLSNFTRYVAVGTFSDVLKPHPDGAWMLVADHLCYLYAVHHALRCEWIKFHPGPDNYHCRCGGVWFEEQESHSPLCLAAPL